MLWEFYIINNDYLFKFKLLQINSIFVVYFVIKLIKNLEKDNIILISCKIMC